MKSISRKTNEPASLILLANPLEMDGHLGPVKAGTVVMAEAATFVHEVHFISR